jgi:hypothetical protein
MWPRGMALNLERLWLIYRPSTESGFDAEREKLPLIILTRDFGGRVGKKRLPTDLG